MRRFIRTGIALLAAMTVTSCERDRRIEEAVTFDAPVGDQCWVVPDERPEDCYAYAPCAWYDVGLIISRGPSNYRMVAAARTGTDGQIVVEAASPEALARRFPEVLSQMSETPPRVDAACVWFRPDQSLRVDEVQTFHSALAEQNLRHIGFFAQLAEE